MPFPFEVHNSSILEYSQQFRWIHTEKPIDVKSALHAVADESGYSVKTIEPKPDKVTFPVPSAPKTEPTTASGPSDGSYRITEFNRSTPIATVHDFGTDAPIATPQVHQLLDKAPGKSIAVAVPQNVGSGNLFAHALSRYLEVVGGKVALAGVDSKSRSEARLSGPSHLDEELSAHRNTHVALQQREERFSNISEREHQLNLAMAKISGNQRTLEERLAKAIQTQANTIHSGRDLLQRVEEIEHRYPGAGSPGAGPSHRSRTNNGSFGAGPSMSPRTNSGTLLLEGPLPQAQEVPPNRAETLVERFNRLIGR